MLPSTAQYAAKKRKKPVQKIPKPPPPDGAKSNPSKRHRDRLNGELDKLTSLLPFTEEVRSRLDKLSVLRLSVGYLKVKSFFNATMKKSQNSSSWTSERSLVLGANVQTPSSSALSSLVTSVDGVSFSEGDLLLQALNGFVLVVTAEGYVFYTSPTIQDFLGFHQSDVIHQSVFELIHTDDRALFRRQLHFALKLNSSEPEGAAESLGEQNSADITNGLVNYDTQSIPPENSSFLERNFCCRFRCLLDNSSGFLALNFHGRLKFLHGQSRVSEDGTLVPPQLALFAVATPLQPPSILEIRTKTLIFQTKHKLDFTPLGIDTRGKVVLGYNEVELCMKGSGYSFIHAADMMYCAENHLRMMKTGDSGLTFFRLLTKSRKWVWVQAIARLVFKGGKPDFIVARQRALTNEEGEEQLCLRRIQLPFNFATGEALLYDITPNVSIPDPCSAPKQRKVEEYDINPNSVLGCMLNQDQSIYCEQNDTTTLSTLNDIAFKDTHATVNFPGDIWQHPSPKPEVGSLMKSEATVQDMMETLQQVLGDSSLINTLDVGPEELKSWESTLLRMNGSTCEMGEELNDILSNDILSYVEEQLQKEEGLKLLDPLEDFPVCLSTLDIQNQDLDQALGQNFSWTLEPQNQLIPNGGNLMAGQPDPAMETMKLTHMDPPQLSYGLNGPALQQTLPPPVFLGELGAPVTFNPPSCAQIQNKLRNSHASAKEGFRSCGLSLPARDTKLNPGFNFQGDQWSVNKTDHFGQTYTQNASKEPGFTPDPSPSSCLKGHFALQTQNSENQRQSWLLEQQQHQQISPCFNKMSGFQRNPPLGVVAPQTAVNGRLPFRIHETPVQQDSALSISCMFRNGVHQSQPLSCQQMNLANSNPIPSKPSCFYQGLPAGGSVPGMTEIPNPNEAVQSCQTTASLNQNGLPVQQDQLLTFSEETQINSGPLIQNGGFNFSALPTENMFYSKNNPESVAVTPGCQNSQIPTWTE
ncbi:aryl hydrocarbon receptor-like [Echeneis naucrates]|uniref:Aryl hydrocarbon receptor n=1 Tax=Echeneis naucrates TaxID=173247 RepID=A0A665UP92_ECHNA|nr:aryl hydrocarbon receptor-like [Echeneis naucrates]